MELVGERVLLREFQSTDAEAVQRYAGDPAVARHFTWGPNTPEQTTEFVQFLVSSQNEDPRTNYDLAIVLRSTHVLIGDARLTIDSNSSRRADLGFIVRTDRQGEGYATDAARLLISLGFRELKLHRVWAMCEPDNVGSIRVLEKLNMKKEGQLREQIFLKEAWRDLVVYGLLASDWK